MAQRLRQALASLLREPLVHFFLLGAALFLLHRRVAGPEAGRRVVVSREVLSALRLDHRRRYGVPPTADEEKAAIGRHVEEEILYREALALGLHRGDVIVRRRLVQKMELLSEPERPVAPPSDAEILAFVQAHPGKYDGALFFSLVHVFASNERHGARADEALASLLPSLAGGADPAPLGDPFVHGPRLSGTENDMARRLGDALAARLPALPVGSWQGPLRSSFGAHLVKIERRQQEPPDLARARQDWQEERRRELSQKALARVKSRYAVEVEGDGP